MATTEKTFVYEFDGKILLTTKNEAFPPEYFEMMNSLSEYAKYHLKRTTYTTRTDEHFHGSYWF